jgi:acetolactate synthase-1/3 small subunit
MKHTIIALLENEPGVLNRVVSLFRRRNFNIESLTVCQTESPDYSRMTLVIDASENDADLLSKNLAKLINVIDVQDVTHEPIVVRDLALVKIKADAAVRAEIMDLVQIFNAKVVDVSPEELVVEVVGYESRVDNFLNMLRPKGVIEMARTGRIAMPRCGAVPHTPSSVLDGHLTLTSE